MAASDDVDRLNERYHLASGEFLKGNPEPVKELWSHKDDVSLANPYGPNSTGRQPPWRSGTPRGRLEEFVSHALSYREMDGKGLGHRFRTRSVPPTPFPGRRGFPLPRE
jgi:hypothetical protein